MTVGAGEAPPPPAVNPIKVKRITYVGTAVLVGDEFGSLLLEYAAALARDGTSETIAFRGISEHDLREEEVSFIVGPASEIVVEGLLDDIPATDPDNAAIVAFMQQRIQQLDGRREPGRHVISPEPSAEPNTLVDGLDI